MNFPEKIQFDQKSAFLVQVEKSKLNKKNQILLHTAKPNLLFRILAIILAFPLLIILMLMSVLCSDRQWEHFWDEMF
ncbi:MAG TPA: hypothetical protein V6C71_26825 [Coleofasciculaceae cyanobacterium]|jgi:hypothetical protein